MLIARGFDLEELPLQQPGMPYVDLASAMALRVWPTDFFNAPAANGAG